MSIEPGPSPNPQNDFGGLQGCFVEGNPEQRKRERHIRRRALVVSVTIQLAVLTAIVLFPLFGKPERLAFASTPIPPYFHQSAPQRQPTPQPIRQTVRHFCATCYSPSAPNRPVPTNDPPTQGDPIPGTPAGVGPSTPCVGCIPVNDDRPQPPPPNVRSQKPQRVLVGHLEPAMLVHRVEPQYPPLARQIHREGQVELHAIISTDGSIQSLQVVSGDPLFLRSATDAVSQWRYRPTTLSGQPVEIETYITVIYTLQH